MKEEEEIIGNEPVSKLLGGLKRVEAPGDFDFRVKARIARGRPADKTVSLLPNWVRVTVPLALLIFVGGYFGYRSVNVPVENYQLVAETQQPAVTQVNEVPVKPIEKPAEDKPLIAKIDEKISNTSEKPGALSQQKLVNRTVSSDKKSGDGSYEMTQRIASPKFPKKPKEFESTAGINAKAILSQMGVDANYSDASWKIGNVKPNSIAERSGVKSGDVIEAINDQNLTEKTTLATPFSGKSVRVRRDGKSMQIELKR